MEPSVGRRSARIAAGLLASSFWVFSQVAPVTRVSEDRIRNINRQIRGESDAAAMHGLLKERARILAELMEKNPRAAVESALPDQLRIDLARRVPGAESFLEERGEWTGEMVTSVADDFKHARSQTLRTIRIQQHTVKLFWDSPPATVCSPSATVRGIRLGDAIAATSGEVAADPGSPCTTTGDQKTVVLLLSYPSTPITPGYTQSYVNRVFFGPAPSVADYWRQGSYGNASASGDVFGPFTLNADYTCNQTGAILQSAIEAADATVDFTAYQHIFLLLPVTVTQFCGWDGLAQLGCSIQVSPSKGNFPASVSWIETISLGPNIYGALGGLLSTAIHEGGHNFGLRHASSIDYDTLPVGPPGTDGVHSEYGNPFSFMALDPGDFAAPHKNMLGWLQPGTSWLQVQSGGTWTLAPLSLQSGSLQALRVQRYSGNSSASNQWLWIEYRQPIGPYEPTVTDIGAPRDFKGALINIEDPSQAGWDLYTELLDFQPVRSPNDFSTSILKAGTTWSDPYSNLTITAGSATPSGLTITVSYDNGCATISPASRSLGPAAGTGQISVSAAPSCAWIAVAGADWITFPAGASGMGPGTVNYSVTTNSGTAVRSAIISISHQTFTMTQTAQPQAGAVSVTPSSGVGASHTFTFVFSDPVSWTDITSGEILMNAGQVSKSACYIHWDAAGNRLSLRDDADDGWLGPVPVGGSGVLANSQCELSPESASVAGAGASVTLRLTVAFTNLFAGDIGFSVGENALIGKMIFYMQEQSAATAVGWQQAGTWNPVFAFTPLSVTPSAGSGSTQVFTFTAAGLYSGDQINMSFATSTAFGTLEFYDYACGIVLLDAANTAISLYGDVPYTNTDGNLGTGPALQNSQCILDAAASSGVLSGTTLTLQLAIAFKPSFLGTKNIYLWGPGTGFPDGALYAPIGTFTVTPPAAAVHPHPPREPPPGDR